MTTAAPAATRTAATRARYARLGRTDLEVCRIGIGCGGIGADVLEYAVDRGANYVFTSSDVHGVEYGKSYPVIRRLCGSGSARRESIVLVATSYVCDPEKIAAVVADQLTAWGTDYVDVFQWGWVTRRNTPHELLVAAQEDLTSPFSFAQVRSRFGIVREVGEELYRRGYARYVGVSTHDRSLAAELAGHPSLDVLMLRYNVAHRGAERDVFKGLGSAPPGIVTFNTLHDGSGPFGSPSGDELDYEPTATDLFGFSLDRPEIDLVLAGPRTCAEVDAAFRAFDQPPHDPAMVRHLRRYGDVVASEKRW